MVSRMGEKNNHKMVGMHLQGRKRKMSRHRGKYKKESRKMKPGKPTRSS